MSILNDLVNVANDYVKDNGGEVFLKELSNRSSVDNHKKESTCRGVKSIKKRGVKMTNKISKQIDSILQDVSMDDTAKRQLSNHLSQHLTELNDFNNLETKLNILYAYEKNYLNLIKEYKEEIKFAGAIQEDLRKERAKFFSETLKEVSATLKDSQVDSEVASTWLRELVNSYTKSLDVCAGLIDEQVIDMIGKIRKDSKDERAKVNI